MSVCALCSAQGSEQSSQHLEQNPASGLENLEVDNPKYSDEDGVQNKYEKYHRNLGYVENSEFEDNGDSDSSNPSHHQVTLSLSS